MSITGPKGKKGKAPATKIIRSRSSTRATRHDEKRGSATHRARGSTQRTAKRAKAPTAAKDPSPTKPVTRVKAIGNTGQRAMDGTRKGERQHGKGEKDAFHRQEGKKEKGKGKAPEGRAPPGLPIPR